VIENKCIRNKRLGQISIDYIAGYIFFIFVVLYVSYSLINTFPAHYNSINTQLLNEEVWILSEKLITNISSNGIINESSIEQINHCTPLYIDYEYYLNLKKCFEVSELNDFYLNIKNYPIAITTNHSGDNFTGILKINNKEIVFETYQDILNQKCDRVRINDGSDYYVNESDEITLDVGTDVKYTIEQIDYSGKYVILSHRLIDCGKNPGTQKTSVVNRYLTYNESIAKINLVYW